MQVVLTDLLVQDIFEVGELAGHLPVLFLHALGQLLHVGLDILLLVDSHSDLEVYLDFGGDAELPEEGLLEVDDLAQLLLALSKHLDYLFLPACHQCLKYLLMLLLRLVAFFAIFIFNLGFIQFLKLNLQLLGGEMK